MIRGIIAHQNNGAIACIASQIFDRSFNPFFEYFTIHLFVVLSIIGGTAYKFLQRQRKTNDQTSKNFYRFDNHRLFSYDSDNNRACSSGCGWSWSSREKFFPRSQRIILMLNNLRINGVQPFTTRSTQVRDDIIPAKTQVSSK
jgi:hypothetical protein